MARKKKETPEVKKEETVKARIIGAGKPKIILLTLIVSVFLSIRTKSGFEKNFSYCAKPTQGLPHTPSLG